MRLSRPLPVFLCLLLAAAGLPAQQSLRWTPEETRTIRGLWIGSLEPLPPEPSNAVCDDPRAVSLGHRLFFDTRFSLTGTVACATCHKPELGFQDGLPVGVGVGKMNRRTMPIAGTAYSPWLFWDGRKDSQWAQALGPMESAVEHGGNRTQYAHLVSRLYRGQYEAIFGPLPDLGDARRFPSSAGPVDDLAARAAWLAMTAADRTEVTRVYADMGKAIAAYERRVMPGPSRFDAYASAVITGDMKSAVALLTADEQEGLRLFIGKGQCIRCHDGPLLTDNDFHNTGVPPAAGLPDDRGRAVGAVQVLADEFNCMSPSSDSPEDACGELKYLKSEGGELLRAFKPPSLRNVAERAPYMHAGQFATLREVLRHYSAAPPAPAGRTELEPLGLNAMELGRLEAFLSALSGPLAAPPELLAAPRLP
jgi:cytochrome c peroxidase